jgi:hypothetical protein
LYVKEQAIPFFLNLRLFSYWSLLSFIIVVKVTKFFKKAAFMDNNEHKDQRDLAQISKREKIKNLILKKKGSILKSVFGSPTEKVYCGAAILFGILALTTFPTSVLAKSELMLNNMPIPLGPDIPKKSVYNYVRSYFSISEWASFLQSRKISNEFNLYVTPLLKPTAFFVLGSACTAIYGLGILNGAKRDNLILDSMVIECYEDNMKLMAGLLTDLKADL